MGSKTSFDADWKFYRGDLAPRTDAENGGRIKTRAYGLGVNDESLDDSGWETVRLPHDYVVEGNYVRSTEAFANKDAIPAMESIDNYLVTVGSLPGGIGWYRKTFEIAKEDEGKRVYLQFDGIYRESTVYLNRYKVGGRAGGFAAACYDVTDFLNYGSANLLTVRIDSTGHEGWWYNGGGIYRHAWLVRANPLHVKPWGTFVKSDIDFSSSSAVARVTAEITVLNRYFDDRSCAVVTEIYDQEERCVAVIETEAAVKAYRETQVNQEVTLLNPSLWSVEAPYLYKAVTKIIVGGEETDLYETPFGIRSVRFDPDEGFFLNERPLKIKGVCCHQDHAGLGAALPDRMNEFRIEKLKEMGANAYRTAHHPPTPELMDACDRLGILVLCENRFFSTAEEDLEDLTNMVLVHRNHPSIFLWSLGNEETGVQFRPESGRFVRAMKATVRNLDDSRPITVANCFWDEKMKRHYEEWEEFRGFIGSMEELDVAGFNYAHEIWDKYHEFMPRQPMLVSEATTMFSTRGSYETSAVKSVVYSMDSDLPLDHRGETQWRMVAVRPYLSGIFVWTGFDYKGEPSPFSWPGVSSQFGILDSCGFPKDIYYYYKAWWSDEPVLYLFPHWNWPNKTGEPINVHCFGNMDEVELFLNGRSLGRKEMLRNSHLTWDAVVYEPGALVAKGYKSGSFALEYVVETTDSAHRVELMPDREVIRGDGADLAVFTVRIVDRQGRVVPTADSLVSFEVQGNGRLLGVGNGNPGSHESDKASHRRAFNGLCQLIVQSEAGAGVITVRAVSDGLITGIATVDCE